MLTSAMTGAPARPRWHLLPPENISSSPWQPVIAQTTQHWAVIRSVSKALGPDLRLAIVASDSSTSA
ncbi:hypothetical protein F3A62_23980, partial [Salmonella enterica subsp. enterica serovar Typhi]|nr:hypothetical protein [Salmonella enterica subsp. enterica serovar Typhi]